MYLLSNDWGSSQKNLPWDGAQGRNINLEITGFEMLSSIGEVGVHAHEE